MKMEELTCLLMHPVASRTVSASTSAPTPIVSSFSVPVVVLASMLRSMAVPAVFPV